LIADETALEVNSTDAGSRPFASYTATSAAGLSQDDQWGTPYPAVFNSSPKRRLGGRCKSTLRSGVVAASMIVGLR
jgi:hypothetical protein